MFDLPNGKITETNYDHIFQKRNNTNSELIQLNTESENMQPVMTSIFTLSRFG